jgi:hypothetical protein
MVKILKLMSLSVIIFTALLLLVNCSKEEDNQAPVAPSNPSPANNDDSVSPAPVLSWSACTDPQGDTVKYDVYLGITNPPDIKGNNLTTNSYTPDTLLAKTKYYWRVVAKDNKNNASSSAVWSFTTGDPILPDGDLQVIVCNQTSTNFYGGAQVYLYKSYSERLNDASRTSYYRMAVTDNTDPVNVGAIFYGLTYQKYYLFVKWTDMTNTYTGEGETFVPKGKMTKVTVKVQ